MEDQTSWKGHTFTLIVFTGIVVLCSIFFILGMLVGRTQGQKLAIATTASAASRAEAKAEASREETAKPDLTFYESVKKTDTAALEPPPADPRVLDPPKKVEPEPAAAAPVPANVLNYQVGAVRKSSDADKLLAQVRKKGFRAFILAPSADEANPFYRIQVGPFADLIEAEDAKKKLESAGYKPILKK
jgi:cell division septation protein DedD